MKLKLLLRSGNWKLKAETGNGKLKLEMEQVDILISKNQALQILYLKHCVYNETT